MAPTVLATMVTTTRAKITNTKWIIKIGMILYDLLSFDKGFTWDKSKRLPCHISLSYDEVIEREPVVKREGLTGASVYYDCISMFPERLTLAFIKSALKFGAKVANYAEVVDFISTGDNRIGGVVVRDILKNKTISLPASVTVNCCGPWADIVLGLAKREVTGEQLRRSEGIHIITRKLVHDHVVGSITAKGRHIFIIPWRGHSLIGTTDKQYIGSPDNYRVTGKSIQELLVELNAAFGDGKLSFKDILHAYGGLRPLVEDQTEDVYESSRKYEIYDNADDGLNGLITVEGGKYTTSRNLAEQVVNRVMKKLKKKPVTPITGKIFLHGSEIPDMAGFIEQIVEKNSDFCAQTIEYLGRNYGREYECILEIARGDSTLSKPINKDGEILAQVVYAVRHEMARSLKDILLRRTGIGTLGDPGTAVIKQVAKIAGKELQWTSRQMQKEIDHVRKFFEIPKPSNRGKVKKDAV